MAKKDKTKSKETDKARKNTSLRLPADTLKALKARALDQDSSVQAIIESLIDDYLASKKSKSRARKK